MSKKILTELGDFGIIIAGTAAIALSIVVFTAPNNIAPGGVTGLATALKSITPIPIGVWSLMLNVPLFILAFRRLGFRPLVKTLIATIMLSGFIDFFTLFVPVYNHNVLVAAVFGGTLSGAGMGLLFLHELSTGGTDLLSLIISKRFREVHTGTILLVIDCAVVIFAMFIFRDIDVAMYSAISIFVASKVIDAILQGADYAKVIYVITNKGQAITDVLLQATDRGVTVIPASGGYTGEEKQMLTCVVRRGGVTAALNSIKKNDPEAFAFVVSATEVHGEGFKSFS
jgi:uncharacterized membrane-anchored protein YitT (DUF2179 family)